MQNNPSLYFSDGKRTIDFILVYKDDRMSDANKAKLAYFLDSIKRTGLDFELDPFMEQSKKVFVKINAPKDVIIKYADICDIDLSYRTKTYRPRIPPWFKFMATPLTRPNPDDEVYKRAPQSVSGAIPDDITNAEKIMVVNKILIKTKYGDGFSDYGIRKLLRANVFIDYFPIHGGPYQWTESGPLTDRQLLSEYWGSLKCWYKEQPLYLIERYYGSEVGFYFAWCGFYMRMLIPVAVMGVLCIIYGLLTMFNDDLNMESPEICKSILVMCPRCHYHHCKFERLSTSCLHSYITYLHDNRITITFAVIVSFWSTIFIRMWQRKEAELQIDWHVKYLEHDTSMRPEFAEAATKKRYSPITGEYEPYIPKTAKLARYTVTLTSVVLLLVVMIFATIGVMAYRITVSLILIRESEEPIIHKHTQIIASVTGSMMSVTIIFIFKFFYQRLALWLTNLENPRTLYQFDNSYIYKSYALAFTNNYSAVIYIAFFKGRFYTHPGDLMLWSAFGGLGSDVCDATGCIMDLSLQLMSIMTVKIFVNNLNQTIIPIGLTMFRRVLHGIGLREELPQYAAEYMMPEAGRFFLIDEYMDMVIQYGFIVFFIAGFPLAPFLALANNFIELRIDAFKMTRTLRRPVPRRVAGMGAWFAILQAATHVGVVTNAVVIAFTTNFIPKVVYRAHVDRSLKHFINTTLSAYETADFTMLRAQIHDPGICYYPGRRFPPNHPNKYEPTTDFWFTLALRFLVVVVFEHVVIYLKGTLAYAIPSVPTHVTEELAIEERKNKEARMKVINAEFVDQIKGFGFSSGKPLELD